MRDIMELLKSGKSVHVFADHPRGPDGRAGASSASPSSDALTGDMPADDAAGGQPCRRYLRFTRGATRQQIVDKMLADQKKLVDEIWAAARARPAAGRHRRIRHPGLDRREGDRHRRRALARRRRLPQPAEQGHAAAVRSDDHLRPVRRRGQAGRPADLPVRHREADALQHLCDQRPAADADRQSGPGRAGSRRQPVARPTISISSPTAPAAMSLPRRSTSTTRTSRAGGHSEEAGREPPRPEPKPRCRSGDAGGIGRTPALKPASYAAMRVSAAADIRRSAGA